MSGLTEKDAQRILAAFGDPFLRYIFALNEKESIVSTLQVANAGTLEHLEKVIDQSVQGRGNSLELAVYASQHFCSYREDLEGSLANHLHRTAGGAELCLPVGDDPVVQSIRKIAVDTWPGFLLPRSSQENRTIWMSNSIGVISHPGMLETCQFFLADEELRLLFPSASPTEDTLTMAKVYDVSADWVTNKSLGGTRQLVSLIGEIIFDAFVRAQVGGSSFSFRTLMAAIPGSLGSLRVLATKRTVEVTTIVGFSAVRLEEGQSLKFGDDELRAALPFERDLLLGNAEQITCVLVTKYPLQLLKITSAEDRDTDWDISSNSWDRYVELVQETHRTVQKRIDRIRLSILLATSENEHLATREVARYVADLTSIGGSMSWAAEQLSLSGPTIASEQHDEILRLHRHINEKHPVSLDIAMKRILNAVSQRLDATDAFIDAVIVWENAFGTTFETSFRVTGAIAKLLERTNPEKRLVLQKELKRLYETRSRLVHGAKEPKPEEAWAQRERAIEIAIEVLRALYALRPDLLELNSDARGVKLLLEG